MITTVVTGMDDWSAVDAENLAKFLDSDTGRRFLVKLADQIPPLLDSGHLNRVLIRSGEVRGQTALIQSFQNLAHPTTPPGTPADAYPSLEDDTQWVDGDLGTAEPKSAPKPE
jgi:hypothetical protein